MQNPEENFSTYWKRHFGNTPPIGEYLRAAIPERWVRLHALPKSKRYPETIEEWNILLERANLIGGVLFEEHSDLWLVSLTWEDDKTDSDPVRHPWRYPILHKHVLTRQYKQVVDDSDPDHVSAIGVHASRSDWNPNKFDMDFKIIADDYDNGVWCQTDRPILLVPYDGGFDVFLENATQTEKLRQRFIEWYPEGGW